MHFRGVLKDNNVKCFECDSEVVELLIEAVVSLL